MNLEDVAKLRLINHQIACSATKEPGEVVASLGAMQAQDYQAALWAVGLRAKEVTLPEVESA
ncbi:MAG: winged helix DNA-binding domain-containing protein, partial [Pseudobdellovibrionaceae bacterium]